jgi:gluconolactonase
VKKNETATLEPQAREGQSGTLDPGRVGPRDGLNRRELLKAAAGLSLTASAATALAQDSGRYLEGGAPVRYPDPDVVSLDGRFRATVGTAAIERLHTGTRWAEGPAWHPTGRFLVWSDIGSNTQLRWMEEDGHVAPRYRSPSNYSNGNTFDREGRQISCEHGTRRVVRYEPGGGVTVLCDSYGGKSLNAPNDAVVHPGDGSIWFTDPGYGSLNMYEGTKAETGSSQPYQKEAVYRIDTGSGQVVKLTDEIYKPNGLCFSPDYSKLYVADTGASHYPQATANIKVWDVRDDRLAGGREFTSMDYDGRSGAADGVRCDADGNVWAGAGWAGAGYDGVQVFAPDGDRIGLIRLPEVCSNVCFGGSRRNRLFMTASQSLYALYLNTTGAHFC